MNAPTNSLIFVLGIALTACVTVNVYFPASAAEHAADVFTKEVYQGGQDEGEVDGNGEGEPTSALEPKMHEDKIAAGFGWATVLDFVIVPAAAQQPDIDIRTPAILALKKTMTGRHKILRPFYQLGAVGMSSDGLIVVKDPKLIGVKERNRVKKSVADENRDRNRLYTEIAKANGHPEWEKDIRAIFAERWVGNAPKRWWYRSKGGVWQQK